MSNTMKTPPTIRWQLFSTASALALLASAYVAGEAEAADNDADRPTLWIELGGQFERVGGSQELFVPPFMTSIPAPLVSPVGIENTMSWAYGADGKVSFQPEGSDWIFSAAVRYGRAQGAKHTHQQTAHGPITVHAGSSSAVIPTSALTADKFADANVSNSEAHAIIDFQAGREVGLGMFGRGSTSVLGAGIRFAQFHSRSAESLGLDPSPIHYKYFSSYGGFTVPQNRPHTFLGSLHSTRTVKGFGPSLSWDASAVVAGSQESSELTLDWGLNAAVLFGRQKASVHHATDEHYYLPPKYHSGHQSTTNLYHHAADHNRARNVTVPNVGGFAGVSLKFPNGKVSIGYRADLFFGAMDEGIDAVKKSNATFNGPYASISVGIGD
jgi:hypothetical protein